MPAGQKAQATEYVTDVMVIGAYSSSEVSSLASTYQADGWTRIDYDLNKGCGYSSHYIYLLYKTGTNVADAISDLYLWCSDTNTSEDSFTLNGRTYTRANRDGDEGFISSNGDLNKGAEGKYIYLYYTKSNTNFSPARAVTGISFNDESFNAVGIDGGTDLILYSNLDYPYRFAVYSKTKENRKKQEKTIIILVLFCFVWFYGVLRNTAKRYHE